MGIEYHYFLTDLRKAKVISEKAFKDYLYRASCLHKVCNEQKHCANCPCNRCCDFFYGALVIMSEVLISKKLLRGQGKDSVVLYRNFYKNQIKALLWKN